MTDNTTDWTSWRITADGRDAVPRSLTRKEPLARHETSCMESRMGAIPLFLPICYLPEFGGGFLHEQTLSTWPCVEDLTMAQSTRSRYTLATACDSRDGLCDRLPGERDRIVAHGQV